MKNFLFLLLTVTLMLFFSYSVFAEEDGPFPAGRIPGPEETNPLQLHIDAHSALNQSNAGQAGVSIKESYAKPEDQPGNDGCALCDQNKLRSDHTGVVLDGSGNPVKVESEGTVQKRK